MKALLSALCATVLTLSPVIAAPASAAAVTPMPLIGSGVQSSVSDELVEVQMRRSHRRGGYNVRRGPPRHGYHPRNRRPPPVHRAPPRQRSQGPDLGSAIAGAIVGGLIVNQFQQNRARPAPAPAPRAAGFLSREHIQWCNNRWRSYRVTDNSYQPYNGPRRICVSPFGPS